MGSTLVNLGIKEKLPFIKDTKEVIENKIKKEIEITMRTNNNLFLVFNVIHIRYLVVKFM